MSRVRESAARPSSGQQILPLLRRAAAALRGPPDPRVLASTVNELLQQLPGLRTAWVELPPPGASPPPFSEDALTLPLRAGTQVAGVLRHRLQGPPLDGERLRLLGGVADLLGAMLEQTVRAAAGDHANALLASVLEHMPFGAACFGPTGHLLAANAIVRDVAGGAGALATVLLPSEFPPATAAADLGPRVVRVHERLLLVHLHRSLSGDRVVGWIATVFDLGQRAREFFGVIARETYRALWLGRRLALAVLSAPEPTPASALFGLADTMRTRLPPGTEIGPLESDALAILVPGTSLPQLRAIVRGTTGLEAVGGLQLGLAELARAHGNPESFVTSAVAALAPVEQWRRPLVLLYDSSPSVTEALHLALRAECDASRCHEREAGWRLLQERAFDALFAKVELDAWEDDLAFLHHALELQPGLQPFILTDAPGLRSATLPQLPAGTPVFRKPFQVSAVRRAVRERLTIAETAA